MTILRIQIIAFLLAPSTLSYFIRPIGSNFFARCRIYEARRAFYDNAVDVDGVVPANVTYTEWSVLIDRVKMDSGEESKQSLLRSYTKKIADLPVLVQTKAVPDSSTVPVEKTNSNSRAKDSQSDDKDKGTSDSYEVLKELLDLNYDWQSQLNIFRRNIALRANRVLHPARNAQIFSTLINTMISDNEWTFARSVVEYIGLTPATYCFPESTYQNKPSIDIDLGRISTYILRRILELDLERMAWVRAGREGDEPSTPKSRGESVQEWLYTQVHRSDLGYRACDMILAVLRLSLRHAIESRLQQQSLSQSPSQSQMQTGQMSFPLTPTLTPIRLKLVHSGTFMDLARGAGIPIDDDFIERAEATLKEDLKLVPLSFPGVDAKYFHDIYIDKTSSL